MKDKIQAKAPARVTSDELGAVPAATPTTAAQVSSQNPAPATADVAMHNPQTGIGSATGAVPSKPSTAGGQPDIEAGRNVAWLQRFACEPSLSEVEHDSLVVAAGVLSARAVDLAAANERISALATIVRTGYPPYPFWTDDEILRKTAQHALRLHERIAVLEAQNQVIEGALDTKCLELQKCQDECAALRKDAERYRQALEGQREAK